jgi:hypothetical protein
MINYLKFNYQGVFLVTYSSRRKKWHQKKHIASNASKNVR